MLWWVIVESRITSHSILKRFRELALNTNKYSFIPSQVCNSLVPGKGPTQRWDGGFAVFALAGPQIRTMKCGIKCVLFQKLFVKEAFISTHDPVFYVLNTYVTVWLHTLIYGIFISSLPGECVISNGPFECMGSRQISCQFIWYSCQTSRMTILGSSKCVDVCALAAIDKQW